MISSIQKSTEKNNCSLQYFLLSVHVTSMLILVAIANYILRMFIRALLNSLQVIII